MKIKNPVYPLIKEVREVSDIKEVAKLLTSGHWVAIDATNLKSITFVMGRVS